MKEQNIKARDIEGAGKDILSLYQQNTDTRIIYFDGWNGFGTVAVLTSMSQVIQSMKPPPPELHFGRTICIDCSVWKSKRMMQRKIAEELKLDKKVMAMFDEQDEEDDFNGVVYDSRDVIRKVSLVIDQTLRESRFMVIFLNGSDDELVLNRFGIPENHDCLIIWTFRRRFLTMHGYNNLKEKGTLIYTDMFVYCYNEPNRELTSSEFRALFQKEAATIFARYTCMRDVSPTMATDCCLYGLFLHHFRHGTNRFGWAAQTPNLFICDGILQGVSSWEISNELHQEISFECDASILEYMYRILLHEDQETPSLVSKHDGVYVCRPYRWISITSKNKELQEDMPTLLGRASSVFLAFERTNSPSGLPNNLFKQCSKLGVLILSYCAFSFVSPPFLHCDTLRFLGLDHCTNDITVELEGDGSTAKWTCLHSLWVLDLCYTDWDEILSEEKIGLVANLRELNMEGVECWKYTSKLQERLPYLQGLQIIKHVHQAKPAEDINNSFMGKEKLEILDLSSNNNSLRSFTFDAYGSASAGLPAESSRSKTNVGEKDVKTYKISLEGCAQLENLFLRGLHNLVELDLSGCVLIKVLDLGTMIVDVPRLKRLFLIGCENLRAIRWGLDYKQVGWGRIPSFPVELELLCIDTRPTARSKLQATLDLAQHKSFKLQVHAITTDARLARSLWAPIFYFLQNDQGNYLYFNISITSSTALSGEVIQPEVASIKEMDEPSCHQQNSKVIAASAGLYGDVFVKIGDAQAPMQAFPQPPAGHLDRHVEIADGGHNVESEMVGVADYCNLGGLMRRFAHSLHVHNASTSITTPATYWYSLRWCRVEKCRNLKTVFQRGGMDDNDQLESIWASDVLMARCIGEKGSWTSFKSLRHLHLRSCPSLRYALPVREYSVPSLENLHIIHCGTIRHVFVLGKGYLDDVLFPKLTSIQLHDLPALEQISEFKMITPCLKTIKIRGCWSLRRLPHLGTSSRPAVEVEVEKDVWDALEWDGVAAGHHPSLYQAPVHSRYYKRRIIRRSVLR